MDFKKFIKKVFNKSTKQDVANSDNKSINTSINKIDGSNFHKYNFNLAGVTYENRQLIIRSMNVSEKIYLKREYNNEHDTNAIGVINSLNQLIGWVPKSISSEIAPLIDQGKRFNVKIIKIHGGNGYNYGLNILINEESPIQEIEEIKKINKNKIYSPVELAQFQVDNSSDFEQERGISFDFEDNEELIPDLYGRQLKEWINKYQSVFLLNTKGYDYVIIKTTLNVEQFLDDKKRIIQLLNDCVLYPYDFRVGPEINIKETSEYYIFPNEYYVDNLNINKVYYVLDDILQSCVKHHLSILPIDIQNFIRGIMDGNLDIINAYLNKFPTHINAQYLGVPLLHLAIRNDQYNVVRVFIEKGVDINQRSIFGDHALLLAAQIAARKSSINNFESLLEGKKATDYHLKENSFKKLIDAKVDPNYYLNDKDTIWTFAIKYIKDSYVLK